MALWSRRDLAGISTGGVRRSLPRVHEGLFPERPRLKCLASFDDYERGTSAHNETCPHDNRAIAALSSA